jgi:hypothetical protein
LLAESLFNAKPKYLSDGEVKNVYIESATGLLTVEIFNHVPLSKEEI